MKRIKRFKVNIREDRVLSILKYRENITQNSESLKIQILKEIHDSYSYINPVCLYDTYPKAKIKDLFDKSSDVKKLLKNSERVTLFVVTIGKELDNKIEELTQKEDIIRAVTIDAIGSVAVEEAANFLNNSIKQEASLEDYTLTQRYSPGYGDWNIKANIDITTLTQSNQIAVLANQYGTLTPSKSITALIGWENKGIWGYDT